MGALANNLEMGIFFIDKHTLDQALEGVTPVVVVAESHPLVVIWYVLVK